MGCLSDKDFQNNDSPQNNRREIFRQAQTRIPQNQSQFEPFLQSNHDPNFNFPEIEGNIFVGKGLKKMKGYISSINKEELIKKREEFWGTRVEGNKQTWNFLKELCQMPEGEENNMNAMLEAYDLLPLKGCLNITYDSLGGLYEIPNYCINDPYKYEIIEDKKEKPKEEKISFHLRRGIKQTKIICSNYLNIQKVKGKIAKKENVDIDKIRLFFYGKEMKNDLELWNYNVSTDCVVIVMILK